MSAATAEHTDVLIVGGGPAGLAAAIELRRRGVGRVLVAEREAEAGGIPRHANHTGFGLRDLHRLLSGPRYARHYVRLAEQAGIEVRTATTVTGASSPTTFELTSPRGIGTVVARAVLLATGCRERPRTARLVPGDRPLGVLTTGALQQLVYLHHERAGERAVIVGAEHVSFSAVLTLAHGGAHAVAMITEHPRHQTYEPYKWLSATRFRVPILIRHRLTRIIGARRVEAVEATDLRTGATRLLECDTVVFSGDWIPDHELARRCGLLMDAATHGPRVDCALRTSAAGVFAAGNLVHAAETADVAALSGRHAAAGVDAFLRAQHWPQRPPLPILCAAPVRWVSPNAVADGTPPPRYRFTWRVGTCCAGGELLVRQGERPLWRRRYRRLTPALPLYAAADWVRAVDPDGEPITFELLGARALG